jgi:hypothetical protein
MQVEKISISTTATYFVQRKIAERIGLICLGSQKVHY